MTLGAAVVGTLVATIAMSGAAGAQQTSPQELVNQVVANELKADKDDRSLWTYLDDVREPNKQETRRVIETRQGDVSYIVSENGRQTNAEDQKQRENKKIQKLANDPAEIAKKKRAEDEDDKKARELLNDIAHAFVFNYAGSQGRVIRLTFRPNPAFKPESHEAQVFHHMAGTMLVDSREKRLLGLSGQMISDVDFGGGLLGKLYKGGTFELRRAEVAPGIWRNTVNNVHLKGRALLFKTIGEQQDETKSQYKRVKDNLNLAQASEMLAADNDQP